VGNNAELSAQSPALSTLLNQHNACLNKIPLPYNMTNFIIHFGCKSYTFPQQTIIFIRIFNKFHDIKPWVLVLDVLMPEDGRLYESFHHHMISRDDKVFQQM
jgi:hypothetical protein